MIISWYGEEQYSDADREQPPHARKHKPHQRDEHERRDHRYRVSRHYELQRRCNGKDRLFFREQSLRRPSRDSGLFLVLELVAALAAKFGLIGIRGAAFYTVHILSEPGSVATGFFTVSAPCRYRSRF